MSSAIPCLLAKLAAGETLSADETALLQEWVSLSTQNAALYARFRDGTVVASSLADLMAVQRRRSFREILVEIGKRRGVRASRIRWGITGLLVCILALGWWYGAYRQKTAHNRVRTDATAIVQAFSVAGDHALLTTSEGLSYSVDPGEGPLAGTPAIIVSSRAVRYPRLQPRGFNRITTALQTCKIILSDVLRACWIAGLRSGFQPASQIPRPG